MTTFDLTPEQKARLRRVKTVSDKVKVAAYSGNGWSVCSQFQSDVRLYNMLEAVLYLEGYERQGLAAVGTASRVLEELL